MKENTSRDSTAIPSKVSPSSRGRDVREDAHDDRSTDTTKRNTCRSTTATGGVADA